MFDFEFRDPWILLALLTAPLIYFGLVRRRGSAVNYSALTVLEQTPRTWRARLANAPSQVFMLALVAMVIALAGPRSADRQTRVRREGIAIMMIVDRSGSMAAGDLVKDNPRINRLDVVKSIFKQFVLGEQGDTILSADVGDGRQDDVVGLVAFARYADALCPLTLDHGNLVNILDDLDMVRQQNEDGTAIGEGLALAVERLRKHSAQSKVAILLTDGVNNTGDITPQQAAELARGHDVKVYCIGAGTRGLAPVAVQDAFTGRVILRPMPVEIDEQTLKMIARKTSGRYFRATDAQVLAEIYDRIDQLERTEITELRYLHYDEWYSVFVWIALAMIGSGGLLAGTFFRRLP